MCTASLGRFVSILLVLSTLHAAGCRRGAGSDEAVEVKLHFAIEPAPPKVGPAATTIELADKDGHPVQGAMLKLEGNMNHAGMKPAFAEAKEVDPGKYQATLDLTMGGDWFVLVNGTLADGRKLSRKIDVPGVKSR